MRTTVVYTGKASTLLATAKVATMSDTTTTTSLYHTNMQAATALDTAADRVHAVMLAYGASHEKAASETSDLRARACHYRYLARTVAQDTNPEQPAAPAQPAAATDIADLAAVLALAPSERTALQQAENAKCHTQFPNAVGRSTTGLYHQIRRGQGLDRALCNWGRTTLGLSVRASSDWLFASDAGFCKRCFPNGRATAVRVATYQRTTNA